MKIAKEVYNVKLFCCKRDNYILKDLAMPIERKSYNTSLRIDLAKKLRILSAYTEKNQNELLEEAILDLIKKYSKEIKGTQMSLFDE